MSARHNMSRSHEGYPSPSPPADMNDPFNRQYYDNEVEPSETYHRDNYGSESSAAGLNDYDHPDPYGSSSSPSSPTRVSSQQFPGQPDTDSDHDVYGQRLGPSAESLNINGGRSSAPNLADLGTSQYGGGREPYPAWGQNARSPFQRKR
jgi:1,3-beta-glucan synthase